ncbi:MAG: hypothetical protein IPG04_08950 [Polyangiaceae bacterium]|nr:hypothetical protein [Polyangiaceae bacterium]
MLGVVAAFALSACAGSSQRVDSGPTSTTASAPPERPPNAIDELAASYAKEHGLELVGVPYDVTVERITCDHPLPRP